MRYIFTLLCFIITTTCLAQPNSVELKSGGGGSLGLYPSITAAYAAIPPSLTDSYLIELSGIYTAVSEVYPVTLVEKPGASAANTITIRPAAGTALISIAATVSGLPLFRLNNADYIIFDGRAGGVGTARGLTIQNNATTANSAQVELINGSSNNVIRYINSIGFTTSTTTTRGIVIGTITTGSTSGNSFNLVEYCSLAGSRTLLNLNSASTAAFFNERNVLRGSEMINSRFGGVWVQFGCSDITVDSCKFFNTTAAGSTSTLSSCIVIDGLAGNNVFTRNVFSLDNGTNTTKVVALHLRSTTLASTATIANNFFSLTDNNASSASVAGIEFGNVALDDPLIAKVYNNTFRIGGTHTNGSAGAVLSSAIHFSETFANNEYYVKNNIFINERTGSVSGVQHTGIYIPSTGLNGVKEFANNTFNISSGIYGVINGMAYNSFAAYQAAAPAGEFGSNTAAVSVISNTNLHLTGASVGNPALTAAQLPEVTIDIDNQVRPSITYRGADEVYSEVVPVSILSFNASKQGRDVLVSWATAEELNITGFTVERSLDGSNFTSVGFVASNGNSSATRNYQLQDRSVLADHPGKVLYYRLKTIETTGLVKQSRTVILRGDGRGQVAVSVFPNPFVSSVNINISNPAASAVNVFLADSKGSLVYSKKEVMPAGTNVLDLQLVYLAPGVYYLYVQEEGASSVTRLIKL